MAIRVTDIREFRKIIKAGKGAVFKGYSRALIETAQQAKAFAKENAKANFAKNKSSRSKMGRRLTGQLLKGIDTEFQTSPAGLPQAALVVKGVPYGAIHEYGGIIKPKRAKHLWVKVDYKSPYKRLTPTEFMELKSFKKVGNISYQIFKPNSTLIAAEIRSFKTKPARIRTLFVLKDQVKIPEMPYLRPAADKAVKGMDARAKKRIAEMLAKSRRR